MKLLQLHLYSELAQDALVGSHLIGPLHHPCRNNREEGKGVGGPGEGTLGPHGPFPRAPPSNVNSPTDSAEDPKIKAREKCAGDTSLIDDANE
jgi:hypothetical protein